MSHEVGDRTALVEAGRPAPKRRRGGLPWLLLALALAGGGIGGWLLIEQARLAGDDAVDARARLDQANRRAADLEARLLAVSADALRPAPPAPVSPDELTALAAPLRAALDKTAGDVAIDEASGRVIVTLDDPAMFRGSDAELTLRGDAVVDGLAAALATVGERALWIHGHVDDAPLPDDAGFETAWELSGARALAVVRRLADQGVDGRRLAAVAFGASRPVGKERKKNRRIEILVEGAAPPATAAAKRAPGRTR